jgi:UDP-N-acetylmuramate dehydrogenase
LIIQEQIGLRDKNWFNTGGSARFFCEPTTAQDVQDACAWAKQHSYEIFVLGQGANILISDEGFDGLVIRPKLDSISIAYEDTTTAHITAGAGVTLDALIEWCLAHNLLGLEEFSGIPGTVGGSVYINLHYYQFLLEHFLVEAHVLEKETGTLLTVSRDWFNFGYNQSTLQKKEHILLYATFVLKKVSDLEIAYARGRRVEIIRHRAARYPSKNTCGSFFRNFHDAEVTYVSNGKKMIYVAYYLDKVGVKGELQIGGAIVSYQHANMLVNQGLATTGDIISLAIAMQERVRIHFGLLPQPECQLVGFKIYPLL